MQNPWENLTNKDGLWILPEDCDAVRDFNLRRLKSAQRVRLESLPEPFIGNPESAQLVLLGLNPGHNDQDLIDHMADEFKETVFLNLNHQLYDYPFYPLNPRFRHTGVGVWWTRRLRELRTACGLDDQELSERIMAIEWFPYHSVSSALPLSRLCSSQEYSFDLARKLANRGDVIIICHKSKWRWMSALEGREFEHLNSTQSSYVTPRNMRSGLFERVVSLLRAGGRKRHKMTSENLRR